MVPPGETVSIGCRTLHLNVFLCYDSKRFGKLRWFNYSNRQVLHRRWVECLQYKHMGHRKALEFPLGVSNKDKLGKEPNLAGIIRTLTITRAGKQNNKAVRRICAAWGGSVIDLHISSALTFQPSGWRILQKPGSGKRISP